MIITVEEYREKYPQQVFVTGRTDIKYRYYRNPDSETTLALFIGMLGNSDAFYEIFDLLARDYSVITFDYPLIYGNDLIAKAIVDLFKELGIKPWLLGQSLGGFMAQIIAKDYPESLEGLVLSNTASLAKRMSLESVRQLNSIISAQDANRKMLPLLPMRYIKKRLSVQDPEVVAAYTPSQKERFDAFNKLTDETLSKTTLKNTLGMLVDLHRQFGMLPAQFEYLRGKVLLLLSGDDAMFPEDARDALIGLMPDPAVDRSLLGGHIALFLDPEGYAGRVREFIGSSGGGKQ